jgi:hypothetical protein
VIKLPAQIDDAHRGILLAADLTTLAAPFDGDNSRWRGALRTRCKAAEMPAPVRHSVAAAPAKYDGSGRTV